LAFDALMPMENRMFVYRTPEPADAEALAALGRETFCSTFGHLYSAENLAAFLAEVHDVASVRAQISDANRSYRVVQDGEILVGYCKLGFDSSLPVDLPGRTLVELKQLYLQPSHFGLGVADALMQWAIAQAQACGADDLVLSVYSDNPRAQRFYQRYGFSKVGEYYFAVGAHRDHEFLYRLDLRA
jgi:diamine N-acetyltransferase